MSDEWQMISKTRERILTELSILLGIPLSSIDLNASFIQVGGNSLSATALIAACKLHGVFLDLEWIYLSPTITDLLRLSVQTYSLEEPEPYVSLRTQYKALLSIPDGMTTTTETDAYPNAAQNNDTYQCHKSARLGPIDGIESYPMTEIQLSLIHGSQKTPGTNVIHYHETYQTCDIPAMKAAWEQVWRSEPIFQTEFVLHEGNGCLFEREVVPLPWTEVTVANQEQYDACKQKKCLETRISSSFTVITLLSDRQDDCKSTIIWCIHHALIDGYSSSLILEKVRSAAAGMPIYPGPSFARFSEELNAFHRRAKGAVQVFWKQKQEQFESAAGELLLPAPSPNSACKNNITETITMKLQLEEISAFVQKTGITTACLYYAAWALAFSMFVDSDSVVFGVVLSGRNLPIAGVESVVGPVINMLPFHISLESGSTALEYLRCTFSHLAELTSRQWSRPEDGFSRKFSSALAVQYKALEIEGTFLEKPFSRVTSDVPLYVLIEPDGDVSLNYHSDLYSKSHIELLGHIFFNAISALLRPHQSISRCFKDLLPCQVVSDLRRFGNCLSLPTTTPLSKGNLVTLFKQAAARFPNATAIEKGNASLSYLELNTLTTCAAHQISALIQPGEVVCVHADGSINWIVAIYSVLKAGGVYCPFDETLPVEARKANFKAAGSRLFLVPDTAGKVFQPGNCVSCVSIDELVGVDLAQFREDAFATLQLPMPSTNAYLCFTSGSTGVPKGVLCRHDSLVAFQSDLSVRLFAGPGRKISQIMSPAFDGSVHEIFSALSHGATLVLRDSINPFAHLQKADSAVLTPSIANVLDPMDYPKLTAVCCV